MHACHIVKTSLLLACLSTMCWLTSCKKAEHTYKIGVSQCSADIWREKQNAELRMGAYLNDRTELRFAAAYDSDERQVQQIDSLVATGIDLLIVAPNQVATISPAIDRAYDSGLPVIVFERKTNSEKFTAFISADNYEMGRAMGLHIASRLGGHGHVLEVKGLEGSSPAIERHKGFTDAIKDYPGIVLDTVLQGDWTEESAYEAAKRYDGDLSAIDYVFGQNDRMAMGVRHAFVERGVKRLPLFCGIDGLPGPDGGIQLVEDSIFDATYIYPTHGDQLLSLAIEILDGKPYKKETRLMSALVTADNAYALQMQVDETMRQTAYLDQLHHRADNYLALLSTQRTIIVLTCSIIVLLLLLMVLYYLYHRGKITLRRERVVNNLWNLTEQPLQPVPQEPCQPDAQPVTAESEAGTTASDAPDDDVPENGADGNTGSTPSTAAGGSLFVGRFKEAVEKRLADSDLSIEDLAADMNLSRVQLYRKVKSITGSSPVELLRTARLNRAYQLLLTTDKTVSEVAYAVGFSAPSYFAKCFREEFGKSPTDIRQ